MTIADFERWCNNQENKLWRLSFKKFIEDTIFLPLTFMILFIIIIVRLVGVLTKNDIVLTIVGFIALIFSIYLMTMFIKWTEVLSKREHISCLLFKLYNQLISVREPHNNQDLIRLLRRIKFTTEYGNVESEFFQNEVDSMNKFYEQLNKLPNKIYHAIKHRALDSIDLQKLKILAYSIYEDETRKTSLLDSISSSYEGMLELNWIKKNLNLKQLLEKKWALMALWIIGLSILCYLAYLLFDFEKNTLLLVFGGFVIGVATIIYNKK